jgi:hypothetical protein
MLQSRFRHATVAFSPGLTRRSIPAGWNPVKICGILQPDRQCPEKIGSGLNFGRESSNFRHF